MWVWDYIDDATFIEKYDKALSDGIEAQIKSMGIDTSGWKKYE